MIDSDVGYLKIGLVVSGTARPDNVVGILGHGSINRTDLWNSLGLTQEILGVWQVLEKISGLQALEFDEMCNSWKRVVYNVPDTTEGDE